MAGCHLEPECLPPSMHTNTNKYNNIQFHASTTAFFTCSTADDNQQEIGPIFVEELVKQCLLEPQANKVQATFVARKVESPAERFPSTPDLPIRAAQSASPELSAVLAECFPSTRVPSN